MSTRIAAAIIHGPQYRAPRAVVEYDTEGVESLPIIVMLSNDNGLTEARLTVQEAEALAQGLLSAVAARSSTAVPPLIELSKPAPTSPTILAMTAPAKAPTKGSS